MVLGQTKNNVYFAFYIIAVNFPAFSKRFDGIFIPRPTKLVGSIGVASVPIFFQEDNSETCGWISLILHTHIP